MGLPLPLLEGVFIGDLALPGGGWLVGGAVAGSRGRKPLGGGLGAEPPIQTGGMDAALVAAMDGGSFFFFARVRIKID